MVNITQNAPGAQYYDVYINPNGCDGVQNNFVRQPFPCSGMDGCRRTPAAATGPYPNGANKALLLGTLGWPCGMAHLICACLQRPHADVLCFAQVRTQLCQPPDDEAPPRFSGCPPLPACCRRRTPRWISSTRRTRRRRRERELLRGLAQPRQREHAVRDGQSHTGGCAVLLPGGILPGSKLAGSDVRVRRGAVQLDRHLRPRC